MLIKGRARKGLLADDKELASQLKVGMVFQNGALFDSLNVRENVGFMLYEHSNLADDRIEVRQPSCHVPPPVAQCNFKSNFLSQNAQLHTVPLHVVQCQLIDKTYMSS